MTPLLVAYIIILIIVQAVTAIVVGDLRDRLRKLEDQTDKKS